MTETNTDPRFLAHLRRELELLPVKEQEEARRALETGTESPALERARQCAGEQWQSELMKAGGKLELPGPPE